MQSSLQFSPFYQHYFLFIILEKQQDYTITCARNISNKMIGHDLLKDFQNTKKARKYELLSVTPRGIEPLIPAWEASVLTAWPRSLIHFRLCLFCYRHKTIVIIYQAFGKCNPFFKFFWKNFYYSFKLPFFLDFTRFSAIVQ